MLVYNSSNNLLLANEVTVAKNFITRSIGLLLHSEMSNDEAMVIYPCGCIHTFFMKFAIDVIFVDKNNKVVAIKENIKPWRISPLYLRSKYVIELNAQNISDKISIGDEILYI